MNAHTQTAFLEDSNFYICESARASSFSVVEVFGCGFLFWILSYATASRRKHKNKLKGLEIPEEGSWITLRSWPSSVCLQITEKKSACLLITFEATWAVDTAEPLARNLDNWLNLSVFVYTLFLCRPSIVLSEDKGNREEQLEASASSRSFSASWFAESGNPIFEPGFLLGETKRKFSFRLPGVELGDNVSARPSRSGSVSVFFCSVGLGRCMWQL